MTDKQIIIDDCIHLNEWKHCDICEKLIKTKDGANGKKREHLLTVGDLKCDFYPNCYYKQLKAKEQECEELKATLKVIADRPCLNINDCNGNCLPHCKWNAHKMAQQALKELE